MALIISEETLFHYTLLSLLLSAPLSFLSLQFLSAPYGKHRRPGWGPLLYPPLAWFLMESPTLSLSLLLFPLGRNRLHPKALSLFSPFLFHYFHRVVVYPLRLHLLNRRRNTTFENTARRKTAFGETADRFVDDRKTQYSETVDQVIDDRKTAFENTTDRKTAFGESADGFVDDRKTASWETADRKTQYSETVDRVTDDQKTAFQNTTYRKTADPKTQFSESIDQAIDDRKTSFENTTDRKTADPKTSFVEIDDQFIDDRKPASWETADSKTQYSETIDQVIDDRKTAFQNTTHRKTTNRKTTDRFIEDRKTASWETADRKTSYSETTDPAIDNQKTGDRKTASGFPASIAAMAFAYNIWNTYIQARWVSHYADFETDEWFWWRFCVGMAVFVTGMVINVWSDLVLLGLKGKGGEYKVPKGGLFEFVSCPNYFGEVVEWLGWAVMTWSWAGIGFFLFTCSNLVPRAHSHHKWYLEKFGEDYPKKRKAVIPFLY